MCQINYYIHPCGHTTYTGIHQCALANTRGILCANPLSNTLQTYPTLRAEYSQQKVRVAHISVPHNCKSCAVWAPGEKSLVKTGPGENLVEEEEKARRAKYNKEANTAIDALIGDRIYWDFEPGFRIWMRGTYERTLNISEECDMEEGPQRKKQRRDVDNGGHEVLGILGSGGLIRDGPFARSL